MPAALPIISGGLGIYSAIKGAQQQGRARRAEEEQLKQQGIARTMLMQFLHLGERQPVPAEVCDQPDDRVVARTLPQGRHQLAQCRHVPRPERGHR